MLHYACVHNEIPFAFHLMGKFHLFSARNTTLLTATVYAMMNALFNRSTNYAREHRIKLWHLFLCACECVALILTKMREAKKKHNRIHKQNIFGVSLMPKIRHKRSCSLAHVSMSRC